MHLSARMLAKAAAFTCKDPTRPTIGYILVSKVWIQATNGHAAFRAKTSQGFTFDGFLTLTPKPKTSLPKSSEWIYFPAGEDGALDFGLGEIYGVKGRASTWLADYFDIEALDARPRFPDLDRIFPKGPRPRKKGEPANIMLDLALVARLMIGEAPGKQIDIEVELGRDDLDGVSIKNGTVTTPDEDWQAFIMPVRP